ncbi:MAG TPA: YdeI/OmpD-associated family protein [Methanomassiliicoccales archaeon]|nr:YdeI/OmpD-associated family protein [Methanomassiliicoccales archaeon]HPR98939.1 YdeI/OmpD-associated family protein [Methanomassiliicoccales archaeon]
MNTKGDRKEREFLWFPSVEDWEEWLAKNHDRSSGIRIRFFKKASGKASVDRQEALEVALRFGWIDSVLNNYDQDSYLQRFSPRKKDSHWSRVNLETAEKLMAEGKMTEAGLRALGDLKKRYESLKEEDSIDLDLNGLFRDDPETLAAFNALPPSHRKTYGRYILSAKLPETRERRMKRVTPMIRERRPPIL